MRAFGTRDSLVKWGIVSLSCFMLAGALLFAFRTHNSGAPTPILTGPMATREAYWHGRIARVGPAKAYTEFASAVAPLPPTTQHENAHAFGGALFSVEGLSGIATCDARFNYGCYHEFLGRAIAMMGLSVVSQLNEECQKDIKQSPLSCQHGIGHGIEAAEGYDETALGKSLAICKDLPYRDTIGGCYGGVFMEYNMQTMLGDQAKVRPLHDNDFYYPCDTLEDAYQPACAFWSPSWWLALGTTESSKVGALCDEVGVAPLIRDCYQGYGVEVPNRAGFDPVQAAALCKAASKDPARELYCLAYAANSLNVGGGGEAAGLAVCDGLSGASLSYCRSYATNRANQAADLPSPASI